MITNTAIPTEAPKNIQTTITNDTTKESIEAEALDITITEDTKVVNQKYNKPNFSTHIEDTSITNALTINTKDTLRKADHITTSESTITQRKNQKLAKSPIQVQAAALFLVRRTKDIIFIN
jgi:hypothetical protein